MAGLGSFIGGFVDGVDTRQRWDDRKRAQGFEDEDRAWARENQGWAREDRDWLKEDRKYTREERERLRAEQDRKLALEKAERDAWAEAYDASQLPPRSISEPAAPPSASVTVFPAEARLTYGDPAGKAAKVSPSVPASTPPNAPHQEPEGPSYAPRSISPEQPGQERTVEPPALGAPEESPDVLQAQIDNIQAQINAAFEETSRFKNGRGGEYLNNVIQPLNERRRELQARLDAITEAAAGPVNTAAPAGAGTDASPPEMAQDVLPAAETDPAPRLAPPAEADAPPAVSPAAAGGGRSISTEATQGSPGAELAASAAAGRIDTSPPQRSTTDPQLSYGTRAAMKTGRGRPVEENYAVANMMDDYYQRAAPKIMEFYLRNGMIEKAQAFQTWVQESSTQVAIADWSRGAMSAAMGDRTGMVENFARYYNRINDGVSVIPEQSGFVAGADGQPGAIKLTFRDDKTGETWTQTLDDTDDLLQQGILALSPERMFDLLYEQNVRAQEIAAQGLKGDQAIVAAALRAAGGSNNPSMQRRVALIAKDMAANDPGFAALSSEEQVNAILSRLQVEDRATSAGEEGRYADDLPVFE